MSQISGGVMQVRVIVDDLLIYAHEDESEAVVANSPECPIDVLTDVYRILVKSGFNAVTAQWHDVDWNRDLTVLAKTTFSDDE